MLDLVHGCCERTPSSRALLNYIYIKRHPDDRSIRWCMTRDLIDFTDRDTLICANRSTTHNIQRQTIINRIYLFRLFLGNVSAVLIKLVSYALSYVSWASLVLDEVLGHRVMSFDHTGTPAGYFLLVL